MTKEPDDTLNPAWAMQYEAGEASDTDDMPLDWRPGEASDQAGPQFELLGLTFTADDTPEGRQALGDLQQTLRQALDGQQDSSSDQASEIDGDRIFCPSAACSWVGTLTESSHHSGTGTFHCPVCGKQLPAGGISSDQAGQVMIPLETVTAIANYVLQHPSATLVDIMAEFDLSQDESIFALGTAKYVIRAIMEEELTN